MTKVFLKDMLAQKQGHVVTISSAQALYGVPWSAVYAASKAASNMFMLTLGEQMRLEDHDNYIFMSSVMPYVLNTAPAKNFR
jgi:short-subunit dehydrogenase